MNISIVIPNYNGADLLRQNIPKLREQIRKLNNFHFQIILVDDGSTDESKEIMTEIKNNNREENLEITTLFHQKNLGFSSTVNSGVKLTKGELIVLFNTDVYPKNDFLTPVLPYFKNTEVFAVGLLDESLENGRIIKRGRGIAWWEKGFLLHGRGEVNKNETFWVSGGSSIFRKSIWEYLGGFDEIFNPYYWEDIDLSYRAQKAGYKIFFEPKSVIVHEHGKGAIVSAKKPSEIKTVAYRNQILFVWKNITDRKLLLSHFLWLPIHLVQQMLSGDFAFPKGLFQAILLIPQILKRRRENKKIFKTTDALFILPSSTPSAGLRRD